MPNYKGRRPGTRRIVIWANGKPNEWVIEGTKADGDAFEARQRLELEAGRLSTRTAPLFCDFCQLQYRPHAEKHLKHSTWHNVRKYQLATLIGFFGPTKLTDIEHADVEEFKDERLEAGTGPSSINNELRVLRTVLNYAGDSGYPVAKVKWKRLPERGEGRVKVWGRAELEQIFRACRAEAPWLLPVLVFLVNTGCRKGEALAAEWTWIDLPGRMVRIPSNEFWQPKNGLPREVPMSDAVRALLSGQRHHERWVFPSTLKDRYAVWPKGMFAKVLTAAKVTGHPHMFRHTFASHFLQQVPDLFLLSQVLGHSHGRVTELYAHLLPDHLSRARNAVNIAPKLRRAAKAP